MSKQRERTEPTPSSDAAAPLPLKWNPSMTRAQSRAFVAAYLASKGISVDDWRVLDRGMAGDDSVRVFVDIIEAMQHYGMPLPPPRRPLPPPAPSKTREERLADDAARMVANLRARETAEADRAVDLVVDFLAGRYVPAVVLPILTAAKKEERIAIVIEVPKGSSYMRQPQVDTYIERERPENNKASPHWRPDPAAVAECHASGKHGLNLPMVQLHGLVPRYVCCDEAYTGEPKRPTPIVRR